MFQNDDKENKQSTGTIVVSKALNSHGEQRYPLVARDTGKKALSPYKRMNSVGLSAGGPSYIKESDASNESIKEHVDGVRILIHEAQTIEAKQLTVVAGVGFLIKKLDLLRTIMSTIDQFSKVTQLDKSLLTCS